MIKLSFAVAVASFATLPLAPPALAQDDVDQRFGAVHFPTSCNEVGAAPVRPWHALPAFVLVSGSPRRYFEEVIKADPECAIAYWGIALSLLNNPHAPPPASNLPLGLAAIQKSKEVGAKTPARARLHRRALP